MLDGEYGLEVQKCTEILTLIGDINNRRARGPIGSFERDNVDLTLATS